MQVFHARTSNCSSFLFVVFDERWEPEPQSHALCDQESELNGLKAWAAQKRGQGKEERKEGV